MQRNSPGSRSQAIEKAEVALAKYRVAEEAFDYKDFNFIVNKQRNQQSKQLSSHQNILALFNAANQDKHSRSNSPQNERYAAKQQPMDAYMLMKQFELKKRLSVEKNNTAARSHIENVGTTDKTPAASIKICLEEGKFMRYNETSARASQQNLKQVPDTNAYLSLSSKKKNTQYWHVPGTKAVDEFKSKYHVTIQIDPNLRSPQNPSRQGTKPEPLNSSAQYSSQIMVAKPSSASGQVSVVGSTQDGEINSAATTQQL